MRHPIPSRSSQRGGVLLWLVIAIVLGGAGYGGYLLYKKVRSSENADTTSITIPVRRGTLRIAVIESGALQAERLERIRSKVQDRVSIIYIIPEGTQITQEDVKKKKVLVKLDSGSIEDRVTKQEIQVETAKANYTKADEDFRIQESQNEANIRKAELEKKFAFLELERYLGTELAATLNEKTDFSALGAKDLGGAAQKEKAKLESDVDLAQQELERAIDKANWTRRLYEKQYVTGNELKADELAVDQKRVGVEQAKLALDLFLRFDLPKESEQKLADLTDKSLELVRVKAKANSERAQADAKLKSATSTLQLENDQLVKQKEQLDSCTIRAHKPGLVIYASSTGRRRSTPIEEGVTVYERMEIIHLPDLSTMIAEVKVHESQVKKVKIGQKAVISVDAYPDLRLTGRVKRVAPLPDPQSWLQDVKVFSTNVEIDGFHEELKPGMSCRAEITISEISDALYVPLQSVAIQGKKRVCYVATLTGIEERTVQTGLFDDKYVEITSGLSADDRILLTPPLSDSVTEGMEEAGEGGEKPAKEAKEETPAAPPAEVAPSPTENGPNGQSGEKKPSDGRSRRPRGAGGRRPRQEASTE